MTNCRDLFAFLRAVGARNITAPLPSADLATLGTLGIVRVLSADEYTQLSKDVAGLGSARDAILRDGAETARLSAAVHADDQRTHSILFHFEKADKRKAEADRLAADRAALGSTQSDMSARERAFADLVAKKSLADALVPYAGGYVALTGYGAAATRDLGVRLYRVGDLAFPEYIAETQRVQAELNDVASRAAGVLGPLASALPSVDRTYLWAVAIGLAKRGGDASSRIGAFVEVYNSLGPLASNPENRLLSAEILATVDRPLSESLALLRGLDKPVRAAGVPKESALGVAAILLLGRRADGSFATVPLPQFVHLTPSFEAAALLAVVNAPYQDLAGKFQLARSQFASWGYGPSEDVELSAAYLTVSDLPIDGIGTKLRIIAQGLSSYLQYPLVGASILAAIPTLEANETLNLLEQAYETLGTRTGPMPPPELICLAVRILHGVRVGSVNELDPTAPAPPPSPTGFRYGVGPYPMFVPMIVAHGFYYSTFSGMGGFHPGHVHVAGGFSGGFSG